MKKIHLRHLVIILLILIAGCKSNNNNLKEIKVASGGHITHFLPFDLANSLGYFEEEGLKLDITYLKGGTATAQALLSGQVDFSTNSIDHAFKSAVKGKDNLRMVVLMNQTPGMVLLVDSKLKNRVTSISDLKGMKLGVTSKGSATHMVLAYLLYKNGVSPDSVTIFKAGSSTFYAALINGEIDGGIALEPFASKMVEDGDAFVLQNLLTMEETKKVFGGPYNQAGIMTTEKYIEENKETVQGFVNAIVKSLQFIQEHSIQEIADLLPSEVVGTDKIQYLNTIELLKDFYSRDGFIDPRGVENVLNSIISSGEIKSSTYFNSAVFYTNKFIKKNN